MSLITELKRRNVLRMAGFYFFGAPRSSSTEESNLTVASPGETAR
jgi:hypothetical protein